MNNEQQKEIGKFIQEERKNLGMTQEELASKIYVTSKAVSKWENGRGLPNIDGMIRLAELFNISVNELLMAKRMNTKEKITSADKTIINNMKKNRKKMICLNILLSILMCLCLCFLEVILYMAHVSSIYAYMIFGIVILLGFIIEASSKYL